MLMLDVSVTDVYLVAPPFYIVAIHDRLTSFLCPTPSLPATTIVLIHVAWMIGFTSPSLCVCPLMIPNSDLRKQLFWLSLSPP